MLGPQDIICDSAVRQQCNIKHIPHIQATFQPIEPEGEYDITEEYNESEPDNIFHNGFTINFYPHADDLAQAFAQLLKYYNWENFAILYEDDIGNK